MRSSGLVCLVAAVVACASTLGSASDVVELTDANFNDQIKQYEVALAEFYAPWCGHCKKLAPEYEKAATKLIKNDPPVNLIKVDCTAEKATCTTAGVSGYPTLKIIRNGEVSADYEGPRDAEGIVKFMRGQVGPSSKELRSQKELDKFIGHEEHAVIGFFESDSKLRDSYQKVADTERDRFRFAHTADKALIEKYGYADDIVVFHPKRLHNKFEDATLRYDGNYDTGSIKKFLNTQLHGLCGVRTADTASMFAKPLIVVYMNVDYVKDPKGTQYWRNRVLKVATEFKRKLHFAVSDKGQFTEELSEYGLGERMAESKPLVAGQGAQGLKFAMSDEFSVDNLKKFAQSLLDDKLEPHMKSEPIPTDNTGGVKVLVARNFAPEIMEKPVDALIEFYAPWCGHCKNLAPVWDELGEKLRDEAGVVIAKMDATANDVPPQFSVSGFPTLYWVSRDAKMSPVVYQGGRDLKSLLAYVAEHATDELSGYNRKGKKKKKTEL